MQSQPVLVYWEGSVASASLWTLSAGPPGRRVTSEGESVL